MADKKDKATDKNTDVNADNAKTQPKAKSKLKKILKITAWVFGSLFGLLLLLLIFLDPVVKFGVTKIGSWVIGTEITLDHIDTSLFGGKAQIKGLRIANPAGYDKPYMLELGEFRVAVDTSTLFSDEIVIDELVIVDLNFNAEFSRDNKFNITQITGDLKKRFPPKEETEEDAEEEEKAETEDTPKKALLIRNLDISIKMSIIHDTTGLVLPMPIGYSQENMRIASGEKINWAEYLDSAAKSLETFCQACFNAGKLLISAGEEAGETIKSGVDASIKAGKNVFKQGKELWKSTTKIFK